MWRGIECCFFMYMHIIYKKFGWNIEITGDQWSLHGLVEKFPRKKKFFIK